MKVKGIDILGKTVGTLLGVFCLVGMFSRCASTGAPTGGPKDSLPPLVVKMTPDDQTVEFKGRRIIVEFDEYVQMKDLTKEFYVSPPMKRMPTVTLRGRGVQIDIHPDDTLRENTTYSFNFGNSISDNNEGNKLYGFRYVMSTGPVIDSMVMSGYTVDAYTKDSVAKTLMFFYDAARDSVAGYDSLIFKGQPDVIGHAEGNGIFFTQNLKPIDYRVYAIQDKNGNKTYEPGTDMIGFLDSIVNPASMPGFDIYYDTLRKYLVAQPQTYFRMFLDKAFRRQSLSRAERPSQHQMLLVFSAPYPDIKSVSFDGIDSTRIITEYLRPTRDSISFWFDVPSEQLPDTIKGQLTYVRHDSINNLELATVPFNGRWKIVETSDQRRERERAERERQKLIEQGLKPPKLPNPFRYTVEASNPLNPEKNIALTFNYPLSAIDTSRISLIRYGDNDNMFRVQFSLKQDTVNLRRWTIGANWQDGQKYDLEIPEGVFTNIVGEKNDTLKSQFSVMTPGNYATITVNVKGKSDTSKYILQLTETNGRLVTEIRDVTTGTYKFNYIEPGKVRVKVIEDLNGNGVWDAGDLVNRLQPERVEVYVDDRGELDRVAKANWDEELDIDMAKMFAPITMESVVGDIERQEAARLREYMQRQAERSRQVEKPNSSDRPQGGGNTFNPTEGFGM